jgi:hypothetical protein
MCFASSWVFAAYYTDWQVSNIRTLSYSNHARHSRDDYLRYNLSTSAVALGGRRQLPCHFVQKWAVFVFVVISILHLF